MADQQQEAVKKTLYEKLSDALQSVGKEPASFSDFERDIAGSVATALNELVETADEKKFYQMFCPIWQLFDGAIMATVERENEAADYVGNKIIRPLTMHKTGSAFVHERSRAMCVSFVLNSLNHQPLAQTYALRMLLLFATQTSLCTHEPFVEWVLGFMQKQITKMIQISSDRPLFIEVCVTFFDSIPAKLYNRNTVNAIFKFFGSGEFRRELKKPRGDLPEKIVRIAKNTLNAAFLLEGELFFFEIIMDTELLFSSLDAKQKELLEVFVKGDVEQFDKLIQTNTYLRDSNIDVNVARFKIQVLTLVSLCEDKDKVSLADVEKKLKMDSLAVKQLVVKINKTDVARFKIDGLDGALVVEYCQPRRFTDKSWASMAETLDRLIESMNQSFGK